MPTRKQIRLVLQDWLKTVSGQTVIRAEIAESEKGPRPTLPYLTYRVITGHNRYGMRDEVRYAKTGTVTDEYNVAGLRRFTVSVNSYGSEAAETMDKIVDSLQDPEAYLYFNKKQIVSCTVDTISPSVTYSIKLQGYTITYDSDASPTALEIRDGLKAAVNANTELSCKAIDGGTDDVLIIQSKLPGYDWSYSDIDSKLSLELTQAGVSMALISEASNTAIAQLLDTGYEDRAQCDFEFSLANNKYGIIDAIENVSSTLNVDDISIPLSVET